MNIKRNLSLFLVLLASLVVLSMSAVAENWWDISGDLLEVTTTIVVRNQDSTVPVELEGANVNALPGETVNVSIDVVEQNPGFAYLQLEVLYDTNELELVAVENGTIADDFVYGKYIVLSSGSDKTASGTAANLTFKVKDTASAGTKTVEINCMECSNYAEQDVEAYVVEDAKIDVYKTILYTEANKNLVYHGKEFTYTVSLAGEFDGYSIKVPKAGDGYVVTDITAADTETVIDEYDDEPDTYLVSVIGGREHSTYEKELVVTVTAKVKDNIVKGFREFTVPFIAVSNEMGDQVTVKTVYGKVKLTDRAYGDINCDGLFDYYDVSKLFAYYRTKTTIDLEEVDPDINEDGEFNYYDVSKLFAIYRGKASFE